MRKVLPKKWCIEVKKSNVDLLQSWRGETSLSAGGDIYGYLYLDKYWSYKKENEFTEITLEEFKKLVLKENNNTTMEKPQTFCIEGKPHQIKAIYQDLVDMGYDEYAKLDIENCKDNFLVVNTNLITDLKNFKRLYCANFKDNAKNQFFILPQDYSKALEFAKKQLESKYWNKEVIVTLGCDDDTFNVKVVPGKSITFEGKKIKIKDLEDIIENLEYAYNINDWKIKHESVTIGCKHNIPIEDIKKVIDAYNN